MDKELFKELDKVVQPAYTKIATALIEIDSRVISFKYEVELEESILKTFGLNKDIRFIVEVKSPRDAETNYYYKGVKLDPIHYHLRPDDYHEVSTLRMLQECIAQDTYRSDIMYLERGETVRNKVDELK